MNSDRQKIIERIRHLLNVADNHAATENEALVAASLANRLAIKYGLSMESIRVEEDNKEHIEESAVFSSKNITEWKLGLVQALCKSNGCFLFSRTTKEKLINCRTTTEKEFVIAGKEVHRIVVIDSFKYLQAVVARLAEEELYDIQRKIRIKELVLEEPLSRKKFLYAFKFGCSRRLQERLLEDVDKSEETSTSIVVAQYLLKNIEEARQWADKKYGLSGGNSSRKITSPDLLGFAKGKEAAEDIALQPQKRLN